MRYYLRSFGDLTPQPDDSNSQFLAFWERAGILRSVLPAGQDGSGLHTHSVDQCYYILEGEMQVQIGNETYQAGKDTLVFLPAGVPHRSWNSGSVDEVHLSIFAPMPSPLLPLATAVEQSDLPPPADCIRPFDPATIGEAREGERQTVQWLARHSSGSAHLMLNVARVPAKGGGPKLHIHTFDQCYFILSGEMTAEIAGERHTLRKYDLAVIPAGVPHYQWNDGQEPEMHLTMNIPDPDIAVSEWSIPVDFTIKDLAR